MSLHQFVGRFEVLVLCAGGILMSLTEVLVV